MIDDLIALANRDTTPVADTGFQARFEVAATAGLNNPPTLQILPHLM